MAEKPVRDMASLVVDKMFTNDPFSQWLGIERLEVAAGRCVLKMVVRKEMLNGFSIAHGGIAYSLADSALAFASNGHGRVAVSVETSISHTEPVREGDVLIATADEQHCSNRIAVYHVRITNQRNELVALFKGTVYRTSKEWQL
ncbi:MAG: hydroxyphenylacetyl-CoA thioesterase PaaI [Salibacteraceae bacterium]